MVLILCSTLVYGSELDQQAIDAFVTEMVTQGDFSALELNEVFKQAKRSDRILKAVSRPAEKAKPWYEYRKHFLTQDRVKAGIEFWNVNADTLVDATEIYGVPAEIIVAIIGVETAYGRITGRDRVIDALATLAFHYPNKNKKRMSYFRAQLRHLFLMSKEQNLDLLSLSGSYAGAMGIPQFMPESYRKFAVDFNNDGARNIWQDRIDAIGSVANYLKSHGWDRGKSIVIAAEATAADVQGLLSDSLKPHRRISEYGSLGVRPGVATEDELAALFVLEGEIAPEYWLALNNFYVIMRYNPRTKYAMAVVKLAEAIRDARTSPLS
ncbi:MAG: lytic murein transglycosylase B [Gammaproteobacteria bacterium]